MAQLEYLGKMEDGKDEGESRGTGMEAVSPPSTASMAAPTPVQPDDDFMRHIIANLILAKAFT